MNLPPSHLTTLAPFPPCHIITIPPFPPYHLTNLSPTFYFAEAMQHNFVLELHTHFLEQQQLPTSVKPETQWLPLPLGRQGKQVWLIARQLTMTTGWWDASLVLRDLAEAISTTSFRVWKNNIRKARGLKIFLKGGGNQIRGRLFEKGGDKYPLWPMSGN